MVTSKAILHHLSDGRFHSGAALGAVLGVSRTAIWKAIQSIEQSFDIRIQAVQGRGYRLEQPLELLDGCIIRHYMHPLGSRLLSDLDVHLSIDSTNRYLMAQVLLSLPSGYVVMAEHQTAGRGRRGRQWVSPFGQNLYFSLLWRFQLDPAQLAGLSLAVAVAIIRGLQQAGVSGLTLKWPNDVLWRGKKLSGVLLEMHGESAGPCSVVTGVGLNVSMQAEDIDQPWTDLHTIINKPISRNQLAAHLLDALLPAMQQFQVTGFKSFTADWARYDVTYNQAVELHFPDRMISGIARGVDERGALILEQQGRQTHYHAGEVSLRSRATLSSHEIAG